jgi:bifunctional DNase/RNase
MIDSIVGNLSLSKNGFILLLRPRQPSLNRMLPILIGVAEAQSIALALARKHTPRPMTHDLMKVLLDTFGASLKRVEIVRFEGKTFYAQLRLSRGGVEMEPVDARPSDAIALALRCNAPIGVAEEVYEKGGVDLPEESQTALALPHPVLDPRHQLDSEMKKAIEEERYEDAARIRDQIKELDQH